MRVVAISGRGSFVRRRRRVLPAAFTSKFAANGLGSYFQNTAGSNFLVNPDLAVVPNILSFRVRFKNSAITPTLSPKYIVGAGAHNTSTRGVTVIRLSSANIRVTVNSSSQQFLIDFASVNGQEYDLSVIKNASGLFVYDTLTGALIASDLVASVITATAGTTIRLGQRASTFVLNENYDNDIFLFAAWNIEKTVTQMAVLDATGLQDSYYNETIGASTWNDRSGAALNLTGVGGAVIVNLDGFMSKFTSSGAGTYWENTSASGNIVCNPDLAVVPQVLSYRVRFNSGTNTGQNRFVADTVGSVVNRGLRFFVTNTIVNITVSGANGLLQATFAKTENTLYDLSIVVNATGMYVYDTITGVLLASDLTFGTIPTTTLSIFRIGQPANATGATLNFNSDIFLFAVWDREKTVNEIAALNSTGLVLAHYNGVIGANPWVAAVGTLNLTSVGGAAITAI